jgi:hypothetical protein
MIDETSTRIYHCQLLSGHDGPHRGMTPFSEPVVWPRADVVTVHDGIACRGGKPFGTTVERASRPKPWEA